MSYLFYWKKSAIRVFENNFLVFEKFVKSLWILKWKTCTNPVCSLVGCFVCQCLSSGLLVSWRLLRTVVVCLWVSHHGVSVVMGYLMRTVVRWLSVDFSSWGIWCELWIYHHGVCVVMWYLMPAVVVSHHSPLSSVVLYVQRHWVSMVMIGVLFSLSTSPQPLASLTPDLLLCITEGVCLFV